MDEQCSDCRAEKLKCDYCKRAVCLDCEYVHTCDVSQTVTCEACRDQHLREAGFGSTSRERLHLERVARAWGVL
jgi:hypothetical protein